MFSYLLREDNYLIFVSIYQLSCVFILIIFFKERIGN